MPVRPMGIEPLSTPQGSTDHLRDLLIRDLGDGPEVDLYYKWLKDAAQRPDTYKPGDNRNSTGAREALTQAIIRNRLGR